VPISPHALYLALGRTAAARLEAYRALFRAHLDESAIDDIRLALNQNQPLGNSRFYKKIARMMGERRQARPRGCPRSAKAKGPVVSVSGLVAFVAGYIGRKRAWPL